VRSERKLEEAESYSIENDLERITYVEQDSAVGSVFLLEKKATGKSFKFAFDLRYYTPAATGQASGAYIFRPEDGTEDS